MGLAMWFDPARELPAKSRVWYAVAAVLMGAAVVLCLVAPWQTEGQVVPVYSGGRIVAAERVAAANRFSLVPGLAALVWAVVIYGALLARRCVRGVTNLPTLALVGMNVFFVAALIESFLSGEPFCLLRVLGFTALSVSPRTVLAVAALMAWVGMRALGGAALAVLLFAFLSRAQEIDVRLGVSGTLFALCGFLSLLVQSRLPYMVPEGGWSAALLQDFGVPRLGAEGASAEADDEPAPRRGGVGGDDGHRDDAPGRGAVVLLERQREPADGGAGPGEGLRGADVLGR